MEDLTGTKTEGKKEYTQQDFANEFQALVDRTGWTIAPSPRWTMTNHNTFELAIDLVVIQVQK